MFAKCDRKKKTSATKMKGTIGRATAKSLKCFFLTSRLYWLSPLFCLENTARERLLKNGDFSFPERAGTGSTFLTSTFGSLVN